VMAKFLTRLKISEVSAVDRGAGEDCRILLRKRDQDAVAKATAALETSVGLILDSDGSEEEKRQELAETFAQFQMYLDRETTGNSLGKGVLEREQRRTREAFEKIFAAKADDDGGDDEAVTKASRDRHVGHHSLAAAVVEHALDNLNHLRRKHGFEKSEKSHTKEYAAMDNQELATVLKADGGLQALCKRVINDGASGISENDFVSAVTDLARERFADLPGDQGFAKLYEADVMLRKALRIVRDASWGYASA
jgi:hypothetical protein